jgi:hypothetical protein
MEENRITIRINLEQREFEVQGDANYIDQKFGKDIQEYISLIKGQKQEKLKESIPKGNLTNDLPTNEGGTPSELPDSFGEYLNKFPKGLTSVDKLLIACYFVQSTSKDKSFTVSDASDLLIEQGVKLSNASAFNKSNKNTGKIFILSGKNFRVSESGVDHIKSL